MVGLLAEDRLTGECFNFTAGVVAQATGAWADGKAVSYASPQHFCRTCHIYAAVSVDCFECHASRPEERAKAAAAEQDTAALADFLRGKAR